MVKHRYAVDENDNLVDIKTLTEKDRKNFSCVGCNATVRPVLGDVVGHHFRHKADADCNGETYLHRLGKKVFEETYRHCLEDHKPFEIAFNQYKTCSYCSQQGPCSVGSFDTVRYDLVPLFKDVVIEKGDDSFIPDITLRHSSGEPLYIEIAVSHQCSDEKLRSGKRIIEITLRHEDDVAVIRSRLLREEDERVFLFNFKHNIRGDFSSQCEKIVDVLIVDTFGKCATKSMTWVSYEQMQKVEGLYTCRLERNIHRPFLKAVEQAHLDGANPKNCSICKHHSRATLSQMAAAGGRSGIYCSIAETIFSTGAAVKCGEFTPDRNLFRYFGHERRG